jgi:hypothetical protein
MHFVPRLGARRSRSRATATTSNDVSGQKARNWFNLFVRHHTRDVLINSHMARLRSPYLLKMGSASRQFSQPLAGRLTARHSNGLFCRDKTKLTLKRLATLGKYVPKPFGSGFFGRSAALRCWLRAGLLAAHRALQSDVIEVQRFHHPLSVCPKKDSLAPHAS